MHQQSDFAQAAAAYQEQATRAFLSQQEEARVAIEQRDHNLQVLEMRAQQHVQGIRHEAEREILANRGAVQERAQQWVAENMRPLQDQLVLEQQQVADRDNQILDRERQIARLQDQLASIQRQNAQDIPVSTHQTPVPESPMTVETEFDLFEGYNNNPFASSPMENPVTPSNTPTRHLGSSPPGPPTVPNAVSSSAGQPASTS